MKSLKILFAAAVLLSAASITRAQETPAATLIHFKPIKTIGAYIAPEFQFGEWSRTFTPMMGISGMVMFNNRLAVGLTTARTTAQSFSPSGVNPLFFRANYAGLKVEYTAWNNKAIHLTFPLTIGGLSMRGDSTATRFGRNDFGNDSLGFRGMRGPEPGVGGRYVLIQPGVNVEANLLPWLRWYVGGSYRVALATESNPGLSPNIGKGLSVTTGLKVGLFAWDFHKKK